LLLLYLILVLAGVLAWLTRPRKTIPVQYHIKGVGWVKTNQNEDSRRQYRDYFDSLGGSS
jgi:hypothetical protein